MTEDPPRQADPDRRDSVQRSLGAQGEDAAARHLRRQGFRILARNLRTRTGEVDLLVRKRGLLVAVEVKTRSSHEAPEHTVRSRQLSRLRRTLLALAPLQRRRPRLLRVDVVAVRRIRADTMEVLHFPGTGFLPAAAP